MDARTADAPAQTPAHAPVKLADYTPYPFRIDQVLLEFTLHPTATRVRSELQITPLAPGAPLDLFGEDLRLINGPMISGAPVDHTALPEDIPPYAKGMRIPNVPDMPFTLEMEVEINPQANTALEGLYMSGGMYCTQCEAEGFRKITYYPDRPDVMAPFTVRVKSDMPVLLSNGNPTAKGEAWAEWTDPWPKPAYLFALVAGDLRAFPDSFTTASGKPVDLNIWVRPGDEDKCAYAMDALKRSMTWDEEVYGREYDLDVFNIVAVDDFNMGAMENKGLNIFNSRYVLASPDTATDADYAAIEAIVAHEYFHNWTGNRITCRDWFQLCLKEGLTVFRDQQFSADMRSAPVQRISDVLTLRARQFREDAGPLAHNVRPESYIEINNFYTATVYEKGAELIGMLRNLVGADAYDTALSLYFDRHDGQACTIEDWLKVFEDATGRDLSQFKLWYAQAGTPVVSAEWQQDDTALTLTLRQSTPATPGQPDKSPVPIPVLTGLLTEDGREVLPTTRIDLDAAERVVRYDLAELGASGERLVPSLLRHLSAPVILQAPFTRKDRLVLLSHDSDPFNRWEAGRTLAKEALVAMVTESAPADPAWISALGDVASDSALEPAFRALALGLPSQDDLAETLFAGGVTPDPGRIYSAREEALEAIARAHEGLFAELFAHMDVPAPFDPRAEDAGKRALRMVTLRMLSRRDGGAAAQALFAAQPNMTEEMAAFQALLGTNHRADAVAAFEARWKADMLVMDKWFMAQVSLAKPEEAVTVAEALTGHPDFDMSRPNRFRAVIGGLTAGNPAGFHGADGSGYRFLADWLLKLDARNPQTAARMSTAFETWKRYDADRQGLMQAQLARIAAAGVSKDLAEMVGRMAG